MIEILITALVVMILAQGLMLWMQYRAIDDVREMVNESRTVALRSEQATEQMYQLTQSFGAYVERMEKMVT